MTLSAVVPTRNRAAQVVEKARWLLAQPEVDEVVVVADGCSDDTVAALAGLRAPALRVLCHEVSLGPSAARRAGAEAAAGEWLLMLDDDDAYAPGYVATLRRVAAREGADVVSSPWLPPDPAPVEERVATARARPGAPALDHYDRFPPTSVRTPWLSGNYLVRRDAFLAADYRSDRYPHSHFREETDLFLQLWAAGRVMVLTPETYSWLPVQVAGGVEKSHRLRYETWVLRNHWTFLRVHAAALRQLGAVGPVLWWSWLGYAGRRAAMLAGYWLRARLPRVRP